MQYLRKFVTAIAAVLVCICAITVVTSAQSGVCYRLRTNTYNQRYSYNTQTTYSRGYSYGCGWWGRRCRGTRYHEFHVPMGTCSDNTISLIELEVHGEADHCNYLAPCSIAICSPDCLHGRCIRPSECDCDPGWTGPRCRTDIIECLNSNGGCAHDCVNTEGSYYCTCREGFMLASDQRSCDDVVECDTNNGGCTQMCTNIPGSFMCSCSSGYEFTNTTANYDVVTNSGRACEDINECEISNGGCHHLCNNIDGSFNCACNSGYQLQVDGQQCEDIDECQTGTHNCVGLAECENRLGTFVCSCPDGYEVRAEEFSSCVDRDECLEGISGCNQICNNVPGSYFCSCMPGYRLEEDGRNCVDIDECAVDNGGCEHDCMNMPGSFQCVCREGYTLEADGLGCRALPCPTLAAPRNGSIQCTGQTVGHNCTFSCDAGFSLVGSALRLCQTSTLWSGDPTSCDPLLCEQLDAPENGVILVPCNREYTSSCTIECEHGYRLDGEEPYQQTCVLNPINNTVEWTMPPMCIESDICEPNPCQHNGTCSVASDGEFACDCEDTGYFGPTCNTGVVETPEIPTLFQNRMSRPLEISASPDQQMTIDLDGGEEIRTIPTSITIISPARKASFQLIGMQPGHHSLKYRLRGPSADSFEVPEDTAILVSRPRAAGQNLRYFTAAGVDPGFLNQSCCIFEQTFPVPGFQCPMMDSKVDLHSTCEWSRDQNGIAYSTSGIVFSSNQDFSIPLSISGVKVSISQQTVRTELSDIPITDCSACETNRGHNIGFNGSFPLQYENCYFYHFDFADLEEFLTTSSLAITYLDRIQPLLPTWLELKWRNGIRKINSGFGINNYITNLVPPEEIQQLDGCQDTVVTAPGVYSVLRYDGPPLIATLQNDAEKEYIPGGSDLPICFAVNLCEGIRSPIVIGLPVRAQRMARSLSFLQQYLDRGWDFTILSINVFNSPQEFSVDDLYWNGRNLYFPKSPLFDFLVRADASLKFSSGALQTNLDFSGIVHYLFNHQQERNAALTGGLDFLITTQLDGKPEKLTLTNSSKPSVLFTSGDQLQDGCEQELNGNDAAPPGISMKLIYQPRSDQDFFSKLFVLADDTLDCPMDVFVSLDSSNLEMQGVSVYTECPDINLRRLQFTNMAHKFYFTGKEGYLNQFFCLSPVVTAPNTQPSLFMQSSLQTSRLPLGAFMTLLPGSDSIALSAQFGPNPLDIDARMHSVNVSLLDATFNVPVEIHGNMIQFTADINIFGMYPVQISVTASTDTPWSRQSLDVNGKISDIPDGFQSNVEDYTRRFINSTVNQARQRQINAQMALERACEVNENLQNEFIAREMVLQTANKAYEEALEQFEAANSSLFSAEMVFENANEELRRAEQNIQSVCNEDDCEDIPMCQQSCTTDFQDIYVQQEPCTRFVERIFTAVRTIYRTRRVWRWIRVCRRRCYSRCYIFFSVRRCSYGCRSICARVTETYPERVTFRYPQIVEEIVPGCFKQRFQESVATSRCVNVCRSQPDIRCRQSCRNEQRRAIKSLQQSRREDIAEPFRILDESRMNLSIAQVALERARIRRDSAQEMLDQLIPRYESTQMAKNLSELNYQDTVDRIQEELMIGEQLSGYQSPDHIFKIVNITFHLSLTTETPTRFPLRFLYEVPFLEQTYQQDIVFDFSTPMELSLRGIAESILQNAFNIQASSLKKRSAQRGKRQDPTTDSNPTSNTFEENCANLQNVKIYFSSLAVTLVDIHERILEAQQNISDSEATIRLQLQPETSKYQSLINFDVLQSVFNISSEDTAVSDTQDETNEAYNSLIEDYLGIASELSRMVGETSFSEWQAKMELLHNKTQSIAGYPCSGFVDCLDTALEIVETLIQDMPALQSQEYVIQLSQIRGDVITLGTAMNLPIVDALEIINPVVNLLNRDIVSTYWCSSPPNITNPPPLNVSVPIGGDLILNCSAESQLPISYYWRKDGNTIPNSESTSLIIENLERFDSGNYTCFASNPVGTVKAISTSVFVYELPVFYLQPTSVNAHAGDRDGALFTCNATAWPFPGWRWYFRPAVDSPWVLIEGEITNELLISAPQKSNEGWYTCEAFNDFGFIRAEAAYLTVLPISVSRLGIPVNFQLAAEENPDGVNVCGSRVTLEEAIHRFITERVDLGSVIIENLAVQNATSSEALPVTMTIVSQNLMIENLETLTLEEIENLALPSRGDLIEARQSLRSIVDEDGFVVECDSLGYRLLPSTLTFGILTYICPLGQGLHSNYLLCVACSAGTHQVTIRTSRVFSGQGLNEKLPDCQPCAVGFYEPDVGSTECLSCPEFHTTYMTGAVSTNQCYVNVPLLLDCGVEEMSEHTTASIDCNINRPPDGTFCSIDDSAEYPCELPIQVSPSTVGSHSVRITVNDSAGFSANQTVFYYAISLQFSLNDYTVNEADGVVVVTAVLSGGLGSVGGAVVVNITTSDGSAKDEEDYSSITESIVFMEEGSQSISIPILENMVMEPLETFTISLTVESLTNGVVLSDIVDTATVTVLDNDDEVELGFSSNEYSVNEDDGMAIVTVVLSGLNPDSGRVVVTISSLDESAESDTDYTAVSQTLTFTADGSQDISIVLTDDETMESLETFAVSVTVDSVSDGVIVSELLDMATVTIVDDDDEVSLQFSMNEYTVNEVDGMAVVTVSLSGLDSVNATVTVQISTSDGSAADKEDYSAISQILTFTGDDSHAISIPIIDNLKMESVETFTVNMAVKSLTDGIVLSDFSATAIVTILDNDDEVSLHFSRNNYTVHEDDTVAIVTVILSGLDSIGGTVVVVISTSNGNAIDEEDFSSVSQVLTYTEDGRQDISIPILDDLETEPLESFTVSLAVESVTSGVIVSEIVDTAIVTVIDNDVLCGGILNASQGSFESPFWPETYPTDTDCEWTVELQDLNKAILFTFDDSAYGVAGRYPCTRDWVEIGHENTAPIGRFCSTTTPSPVTSSINLARVLFHAGPQHNSRFKGFRINYRAVDKPNGLFTCGRLLRDNTPFGPPEFPGMITHHTANTCVWRYIGTSSTRAQLKILYFDIPESDSCSQSSITLHYSLFTAEKPAKILCGSLREYIYTSTNHFMTITLNVVGRNVFRGFHAVIEQV